MNEAALDLLLANMRVPEERLGDLQASITACRVAEMRIHEICARHGVDKLLEAVRLDLDRAEARMRACIAAFLMAHSYYEDYLETFMGGKFEPLLLPLALTIEGDRMIADFTGASAQVPFPVNSTAGGLGRFRLHRSQIDLRPASAPQPGLVPADRGHRAAGHHRQRAAARRPPARTARSASA